jgi:hypothetical protein
MINFVPYTLYTASNSTYAAALVYGSLVPSDNPPLYGTSISVTNVPGNAAGAATVGSASTGHVIDSSDGAGETRIQYGGGYTGQFEASLFAEADAGANTIDLTGSIAHGQGAAGGTGWYVLTSDQYANGTPVHIQIQVLTVMWAGWANEAGSESTIECGDDLLDDSEDSYTGASGVAIVSFQTYIATAHVGWPIELMYGGWAGASAATGPMDSGSYAASFVFFQYKAS